MTSSVFDALSARWKPSYDSSGLGRVVENSLGFGRAAAQQRQKLAADPSLTPVGVQRELRRSLARSGVARELKAYRERVAAAEEDLRRQRDAIGWPSPAADALAEQRQAELRRHMQTLSPAQVIAVALSDPAAAEALLNAPSRAILPIPPAALTQIREAFARERQGAQLAALETRGEALELAKAAVETAAAAVRAEVGLDEKQFAGWLEGRDPDAEPVT